MLREFGVELEDDVEVRIWDSTAEVRYPVLPERPAGTDGLTEEQLTVLVTRDSMIRVRPRGVDVAVRDGVTVGVTVPAGRGRLRVLVRRPDGTPTI